MRLLIAFSFVITIAIGLTPRPTLTNAALPEYDLIIRHGRVIDGTGRVAFNNDIAIKGDRIEEMGNLRSTKAKREIDARGQVVAPVSSICWDNQKSLY